MGNWQQKSDNILASFYQESQKAERNVSEWENNTDFRLTGSSHHFLHNLENAGFLETQYNMPSG